MSNEIAGRASTQPLPLRMLGERGPQITRVGIGAWAIGGPYEYGWGPVDDDASVDAILYAVDRGVGWIDTAPAYGRGHSEEVVGRALKRLPVEDRPLVFTKCGRNWWDNPKAKLVSDLRPATIRYECEQSLFRLGLESIDLYQIHRPDTETGTPIEDSWGALAALVDEGKVRRIGVSNFDVDLLERCQAIRPVDSVQPGLNILTRNSRPVIDWALAHGAGAITYSPLASGTLTDSFTRERVAQFAPDDWRRTSPKFTEPELTRRLDLVSRLRRIANALPCTISELAVAWVMSQSGVTAAIVGARTRQHVDGWLNGARLDLALEVVQQIDEAMVASRL